MPLSLPSLTIPLSLPLVNQAASVFGIFNCKLPHWATQLTRPSWRRRHCRCLEAQSGRQSSSCLAFAFVFLFCLCAKFNCCLCPKLNCYLVWFNWARTMLLKLPFDPLQSQPRRGKPTPCQAVRQSLWLSFVDLPRKCGTNVFVVLRFSPFWGQQQQQTLARG